MTEPSQTTVCSTCMGNVWLVHMYSRGPTSPPGNTRVGCPDCDAGRQYTETMRLEMSGPELTEGPVQLWRVDMAGMPVSVRGEVACRHLEEINQRLAKMKMALHRLCKMHPDVDTMNVARDGLYQ